jgi:hypothetical protein
MTSPSPEAPDGPDAVDAPEPPEHARFFAYLSALKQATALEEPVLVRHILTDPDQTMAQSAIVRHVDRRAAAIYLAPAYTPWAESMTQATATHPFLTTRLEEWSLFRAIALSHPWNPNALTEATNWLQLKVAEAPKTPAPALTLLADHGRTKRIRHAAGATLRRSTGRSPGA